MFGSPIELIIPAGVSMILGGGLPARGSGVIVFETNIENGKSSSSASPNARRAAIDVEGARPVQHRMLEIEPGELDRQIHQ